MESPAGPFRKRVITPSRGRRGIPPCSPGDRMGCQGSPLFPHSLPEIPDCLRAPMGVIISAPGVTVMPSLVFTALCSAGSQTRGSSRTRRLAMGVTIRVYNPRGR